MVLAGVCLGDCTHEKVHEPLLLECMPSRIGVRKTKSDNRWPVVACRVGNARTRWWMGYIPTSLVIFRFTAGFVLLWDAWDGTVSRPFWPVLFTLAVLSDVVDGLVARKLAVDTQWLREADSRADTALYTFVGLSMYRSFPETLYRWKWSLLAMVASHFCQWTTAIIKFGKLASYHSWTAKLWGVTLGVSTGFLFAFSYEAFLWGPVICGILNNVHEIAISCVLSEWAHDVWDIVAARQLEQNKAAQKGG